MYLIAIYISNKRLYLLRPCAVFGFTCTRCFVYTCPSSGEVFRISGKFIGFSAVNAKTSILARRGGGFSIDFKNIYPVRTPI